MSNNAVFKNTAVAVFAGIVAKTIDFSFRAWYSGQIGSEGMGIFSLVMSAFGIILNLASAGMGSAVSRLVSIRHSRGEFASAGKTVRTAVKMIVSAGLLCNGLMYFAADKIALVILKDIRTARCLVCISPSVIFMGISYCIKGYFYAVRRAIIPASSEFVEQAVKISVIGFLLNRWLPCGVEKGCCAVFLGLTVGEMASCAYLSLWYIAKRQRGNRKDTAKSEVIPILKLTLPMTVSSVGSSFLRMLEDIWIVRGFRKFGMGADSALKTYGLIHGMAMPLLTFPLSLISPFMALLVPEISRAEAGGGLKKIVCRVYKAAWFCGCLIFCIFFIFSKRLAFLMYGDTAAAKFIKPLSLLCPIMLIDTISTNMLSGMGEQMKLLKYSLFDSAVRLSLIYFVLPLGGANVIIVMTFISNILTCALTFMRINKSAKIGEHIRKIIVLPIICSGVILLLSPYAPEIGTTAVEAAAEITVTAAVYSALNLALKIFAEGSFRRRQG